MNDAVLTVSPRIVTWGDLQKLKRYTHGWRWADDAIRDLWLAAIPIPIPEGKEERRILLPRDFRAWYEEVCAHIGADVPWHNVYYGITRSK